MSKHVVDNAKRCLQCKVPQCQKGCPANTPIKEFIQLLLDNKIMDAGEMLYQNNPLSLVCAHVCPQENQCEGHCVLGKKGSPVHISEIEKYISDYYLNTYKPIPSTRENGKVAIIGSGPAGMTIATFLSHRNYDVTIFEGHDRIGGVMRYGIPEFRLPKSILDRMQEILIKSGVRIRPNTNIGTNLNVDDLFRDGYQAVFIGTGVWRPSRLNIKGESFGNVHYAIEYLRNPEVYDLGQRVAVIGVGNVAMDVARTALRHGAQEVYIIGKREEEDIAAREYELEYAKIDGAQLLMKKQPVEFVDKGIILADTEIYVDEDGRRASKLIPDSEQLFEVDSSIIAIGQGPRAVIVSSTHDINVTDRGLVEIDEHGRTTREGVFASGDVVTGAKTVVEAVELSKKVAAEMDKYVREKREKIR